MSTKITLACGETFHLYYEAFKQEFIYLQLRDVEFEATPTAVNIPIPVDVWETIRQIPATEFDLAEANDEEIKRLVEKEVDKRIEYYREMKKTAEASGRESFLVQSVGLFVYGAADKPREEQIASGIEYHQHERTRQQKIKKRMSEHQISPR